MICSAFEVRPVRLVGPRGNKQWEGCSPRAAHKWALYGILPEDNRGLYLPWHISDHKTELLALRAMAKQVKVRSTITGIGQATAEITQSFYCHPKEVAEFYNRWKDLMGGFPGINILLGEAGETLAAFEVGNNIEWDGHFSDICSEIANRILHSETYPTGQVLQEIIQQACDDVEGEQPV